MTLWRPDPTFYPSPKMAIQAPPEKLAYFARITFTSSSTVRNFARLCPIERLDGVRVASIGPITSQTARELGIHVNAEPERYTVDGLVEAIVSAQEK